MNGCPGFTKYVCDLTPAGSVINGVGGVANAAGSAVATVSNDAFAALAKSLLTAFNEAFMDLSSAWVKIPTPTGSRTISEWLTNSLHPILAVTTVAALLIAGGKIAIDGKGQHARVAVEGLIRLLLVNATGMAAVVAILTWEDGYSSRFIDSAAKAPGANVLIGSLTTSITSPGLLGILTLFGIIGSILQIVMMVMRVPLLIIVGAFWPISAAAAISNETALQWYRKLSGWLLALLLFKPVAAIMYSTAFLMMNTGTDPLTVIGGIALTVLSVLALPALVRFFVPMTSAVGGGKGAGAAVAGAATGALMLAPFAKRAMGGGSQSSENGSQSGSSATGAAAAGPVGMAAAAGADVAGKMKDAATGAANAATNNADGSHNAGTKTNTDTPSASDGAAHATGAAQRAHDGVANAVNSIAPDDKSEKK